MTGAYVNPSYGPPAPQDMRTLMMALKREIMKEVNCAKVGVIESYSAGNASTPPSATVRVAFQQVTSIAPDGTRTLAEYPLLLNVPVFFPSGGGCSMTFPVTAGDECLVVFNDRQIDNWLAQGAGQPPTSGRMHDFSDGICFVGLRSNQNAIDGISASAVQVRTDTGLTFVEIDPSTEGVKVHGGTVYEWDCHGYGQKITWTGGSNYTIDNYTLGAVVTTNDHNIQPPGPPA